MICGAMFFLWPVAPILAIVLGMIGLRSARRRGDAANRKRAMLGIEFGVLGLTVIPVAIAIICGRTTIRGTDAAASVNRASNMRQIGMALVLYAKDNQGRSPPDLATLWRHENLAGWVFVCLASNDTPAPDADHLNSGGHLSFVYTGRGMGDPRAVILYENASDNAGVGMNILFGDGQVGWFSLPSARALIARGRE
jgi:hypothetical protein